MPTLRFAALSPLVGAVLATLCCLAARAHAQQQSLVVPAMVADGRDISPLPRRVSDWLESALSSGELSIIDKRQARARFEQRGSSAPMLATHSDLDALARDAQQALYHVASGLPSRARQDVERALARAGNVIESLNRETRAAQHLLDACLYMVRAQLESEQRDEAREQALQCRRLVPDIEPDGTMHPPDVIGVLAEAEAHLRQREPGSLRVESAPSGCAVYVNGRMLGTSPLELPDLSPGEYRVQVECREGQPGRVHRTVLAAGRVVKRIDTRFDSALQTSLDVALQYTGYNDQSRLALDHATEIARVVGATDVILVNQLGPMVDDRADLLLRRVKVNDGKVIAAVKISVNGAIEVAHGHQARALKDLREHGFSDLTRPVVVELASIEYENVAPQTPLEAAAPPPRPTRPIATSTSETVASSTPPSPTQPRAARSSGPSVFGWVLAGTGAAVLVTGWSLYGYQLMLEAEYQRADAGTEAFTALNAVDTFELVPMVTTFAGAALVSASMPLILPEHPGVPAWSLAVGGAGLLTAGVGAYFLYAGTQCSDFDTMRRCTDDLLVTHFGGMLLLTAAPLLTVPIVYMTRGSSESQSHVSVRAAPRGMSLQWSGAI